jgi:hypothetical protein
VNTEQIRIQPEISSGNAGLTYTVKEVANTLKISLRKAYYLCNNTADFKVFHLDKLIRVHKQSFDSWFNGICG